MPRTKSSNSKTTKSLTNYPSIQDKEKAKEMEKEISSLSEGQEFKNWKELFDHLHIKLPLGDSRESAIKHLKCWCNIESIPNSHKLRIVEVYESPLELLDGRSQGNHNIYKKYLKTLLLNNLLLDQTIEKSFSYADFWIEMGMCNEYYTDKVTQSRIINNKHNIIDEDQMEDFFKRTWSIMRNITDSVLESLQNEGMLEFKRGRMIKKSEDSNPVKANSRENKKIGSIETRVLHQMGFSNKKELFLSNKMKVFKDKVRNLLKKETGWVNYYWCFHVIAYDDDILRRGIIDNAEELKKELNGSVLNRVNLNTINLQTKEDERMKRLYKEKEDDMAFGKPEPFRVFKRENTYKLFVNDNYVEIQQLLANLFIDNSEDLIDRIKQIEMNSNEEI